MFQLYLIFYIKLLTSGGENFHYYTFKRPNIKATMLAIGCNLTTGLHNQNMTFDRSIISSSVKILVNAFLNTADQYYE